MDPKLKTALAVVAGVVIGVTLLGGALALPAVFRSTALRGATVSDSYGMMGERGLQNAPEDGYGMMGPRGGGRVAPGDGTGVCPNGEDCPNSDVGPNLPDESTSES
jgi:hypothetical protein